MRRVALLLAILSSEYTQSLVYLVSDVDTASPDLLRHTLSEDRHDFCCSCILMLVVPNFIDDMSGRPRHVHFDTIDLCMLPGIKAAYLSAVMDA
jgi:hypothetical protein